MTWLLGKLVALGFESIEVDFESQAWWLTPVILVAWWGEGGAESRRFLVPGQPRQNASKTSFQTIKS
jgi:hypothetical protein